MAWNKGKPVNGRKAKYIDDDIKANNDALETAIDQDHDFTTGGTQTGKHDQVSLIEAVDIGTGAEGLPILGAQTASGKAELVFTDEDDNDVQITSGGKIPSTSLDMKDEPDMSSDSENHTATQQSIKAYSDSATQTMTNKTLTSPTLTSPTLNTGVSGTAIKDEPDMSSDSDSHLVTQQSIKKYVDDKISAVGSLFGSWTSKLVDTTYQAATDGFVVTYSKKDNIGNCYAYSDSNSSPSTIRTADTSGHEYNEAGGMTMPVKKGDYWKVTGTIDSVYWIPIGS